MHSVTCM